MNKYFIQFLIVLSVFFVVFFAVPHFVSASRVWQSGFETQTLTGYPGYEISMVGSVGLTINSTIKHSGSVSALLTSLVSGTAKGQFFSSALGNVDRYGRVYIYLTTSTNATTSIATFADGGAVPKVAVKLNRNDTLALYSSSTGGTMTQIGSNSSVLTKNTWYRLELRADISKEAGADIFDARLDGISFASTTIDSVTSTLASFSFGGNLTKETATTIGIYFDDYGYNLSTGAAPTSWVGEGNMVLLLPTAAGDGAAEQGTYANIDEVPQSNTTTTAERIDLYYTTSSAFYNVTDSATAGIDSYDTVTLVSVIAKVSEAVAGTSNWRMGVKSASGGTIASTSRVDAGDASLVRANPNGTTIFGSNLIQTTDPTTAAAWTPTGTNSIDNMQVGVQTTDGNPDIWVTGLYTIVEYIDGSPPVTPSWEGIYWFY